MQVYSWTKAYSLGLLTGCLASDCCSGSAQRIRMSELTLNERKRRLWISDQWCCTDQRIIDSAFYIHQHKNQWMDKLHYS